MKRGKRYMRDYMRKRRGGKTSPKSDLEDCLLLLAYEAGEISCGQARGILGLDVLSFREWRETWVDRAAEYAGGQAQQCKASTTTNQQRGEGQ